MVFSRQVVGPADDPYLVRYVLVEGRWGKLCLHRFCRSDRERALHDHPWTFTTLLLWRGYWEAHDQTPDGHLVAVWRRPFSLLRRPATWRHRVELPDRRPVWTIVWMGPRVRRWGFWTATGWCWWRRYDPAAGICGEDELWTEGGD